MTGKHERQQAMVYMDWTRGGGFNLGNGKKNQMKKIRDLRALNV